MSSLIPQLRQHWPRIVVATLSLYLLVDSLRTGPFRYPFNPPDDPNEEGADYYRRSMTAQMVIGIIIDLQRIHIAIYKTSTKTVQFGFNLWLTGAVAFYFLNAWAEAIYYFIPLPGGRVHLNNTSTAETKTTTFITGQQDQPLMSSPSHQTPSYDQIKYWIDCGLHLVVGLGLKVILNQKRRQDLEREEQQQNLQHPLVFSDKDLPVPVASASYVDGFMTEAEVGRLRLRVPTWPRLLMAIWFLWLTYDGVNFISRLSSKNPLSAREYAQFAVSLIQGIGGLYILYRKSLTLTLWLFCSLCITTVYQTLDNSMGIWNEENEKTRAMLAYTAEDDKEGGVKLKESAEISNEEISHMRIFQITCIILFYAGRLWVAWRLVVDLKARNARVARATGLFFWRRELKVETKQSGEEKEDDDDDDLVPEVVDHKPAHSL